MLTSHRIVASTQRDTDLGEVLCNYQVWTETFVTVTSTNDSLCHSMSGAPGPSLPFSLVHDS